MSPPASGPAGPAPRQAFRLPALAYLVVLFLAFGVAPLAFTASGDEGSRAVVGPQTLLMLIPVAAAVFIARTGTVVGEDGIRVRAVFGQQLLPWTEIRGLGVQDRYVFAMLEDGAVRLPCVRLNDLAAVSRASGGRLPEIAEARPKPPPTRRMRRR